MGPQAGMQKTYNTDAAATGTTPTTASGQTSVSPSRVAHRLALSSSSPSSPLSLLAASTQRTNGMRTLRATTPTTSAYDTRATRQHKLASHTYRKLTPPFGTTVTLFTRSLSGRISSAVSTNTLRCAKNLRL